MMQIAFATRGKLAQQADDLLRRCGVQPGERLVEQQHLGFSRQ